MKTTYDRPFVQNVHAIVTYINYYSYRVDKVKYCPYCNCPEFSNVSDFSEKVYCKTCHEWVKRSKINELDPMNYLTIITNLPLRNGGYTYESNKNKYLEHSRPDSPVRCYNDLDQDELLMLDSCFV